MEQNLSKYPSFSSADILCEQYNKFINMLKKEMEGIKYPWLDHGIERRNMSDKEISDICRLRKSCLSDLEKKHCHGYVI